MEILVSEIASYLKRLYVWSVFHKTCIVLMKSVKNPLRNEKMWLPHFYKTMPTLTLFSLIACKWDTNFFFPPWMMVHFSMHGWKSDHICQLNKKNHFPKDFGTGIFKIIRCNFHTLKQDIEWQVHDMFGHLLPPSFASISPWK